MQKNHEPRLTGGAGKVKVNDKNRNSGTASIQWLVPGIKGDGKKTVLELIKTVDFSKIKKLDGKGSAKSFDMIPEAGDEIEIGVSIHAHYVEGIKGETPVENKDKGGGLMGFFKRNKK